MSSPRRPTEFSYKARGADTKRRVRDRRRCPTARALPDAPRGATRTRCSQPAPVVASQPLRHECAHVVVGEPSLKSFLWNGLSVHLARCQVPARTRERPGALVACEDKVVWRASLWSAFMRFCPQIAPCGREARHSAARPTLACARLASFPYMWTAIPRRSRPGRRRAAGSAGCLGSEPAPGS
jgi:hypothetical protein